MEPCGTLWEPCGPRQPCPPLTGCWHLATGTPAGLCGEERLPGGKELSQGVQTSKTSTLTEKSQDCDRNQWFVFPNWGAVTERRGKRAEVALEAVSIRRYAT